MCLKIGGSKKPKLNKKRKLNENRAKVIHFAEIGGNLEILWK